MVKIGHKWFQNELLTIEIFVSKSEFGLEINHKENTKICATKIEPETDQKNCLKMTQN